jgi:hypothetical protein
MLILSEFMNIVNKNAEGVLDASVQVRLEGNAEKSNVCSCLVTRLQDRVIV